MLHRHTNHIPFPQSGIIHCRFQIVRSIQSDFQKVKENAAQKLASVQNNYTGFWARINALTNFPAISARSDSVKDAKEETPPLSATSSSE